MPASSPTNDTFEPATQIFTSIITQLVASAGLPSKREQINHKSFQMHSSKRNQKSPPSPGSKRSSSAHCHSISNATSDKEEASALSSPRFCRGRMAWFFRVVSVVTIFNPLGWLARDSQNTRSASTAINEAAGRPTQTQGRSW